MWSHQHTSLTPDKKLNNLYMDRLSVSSYVGVTNFWRHFCFWPPCRPKYCVMCTMDPSAKRKYCIFASYRIGLIISNKSSATRRSPVAMKQTLGRQVGQEMTPRWARQPVHRYAVQERREQRRRMLLQIVYDRHTIGHEQRRLLLTVVVHEKRFCLGPCSESWHMHALVDTVCGQ